MRGAASVPLQVILYMFAYPPISPFLNSLFTTLDRVFPLFGTTAFALFCFYLIGGCDMPMS
jgi:LMBR1 domain-containing protein 1